MGSFIERRFSIFLTDTCETVEIFLGLFGRTDLANRFFDWYTAHGVSGST